MKKAAQPKDTMGGIGGGIAGPWNLRPTKHGVIEVDSHTDGLPTAISGNDEIEADPLDSPGTEGQVDESLDQSLEGAPRINARVAKTCEENAWRSPPDNLWMEIVRATGGDVDTGKPVHTGRYHHANKASHPGLPIDDQGGNGLVSNKTGHTGSTEVMDGFSTSGGTEFHMGQVILRRLWSISLMVACLITIALVFVGPEQTIVGALVPGSQEWLHYHFFHLPDGRRRL